MATASLKWVGAKPEDIKSAPKMSDVTTFCGWTMFCIQAIEECWELAPETKRQDIEAQIKSIRFRMHGWRLQLDRKARHFEINLAQDKVNQPPRFKRRPPPRDKPQSEQPQEEAGHATTAVVVVATPEAAVDEAVADAPEANADAAVGPQADEEDNAREIAPNYIVQLRGKLDLPNRIEAARHDAAAILSRLRASVADVKQQSAAMWARIADRLSQYRTHSVSFVQHEMRGRKIRQFLTRVHEPASHLGSAGARLQTVWIGCGGIALALRSWRELAPQIDWDSYLFGELPSEESELATG